MYLRISLSVSYLALGCLPIKKIRTERYQIIRCLRNFCLSSITLSSRYGISSSFTFIVALISLVFTIWNSRVSSAERSVMMLITGSPILLFELLPLYMEKSLGYRILRIDYFSSFTVTLSRHYKLSLNIPVAILLIFFVQIGRAHV